MSVATTTPAAPGPLGRGTLGRQLVVRVVLLVAATAILLGTITTVATRQLLITQTDNQLDSVTDRARSGGGGGGGPGGGLLQPGQPIGTIYAAFGEDGTVQSGILTEPRASKPTELPTASLQGLSDVRPDGEKVSLDLPGLGHYRLAAFNAIIVRDGQRQSGVAVVGVPLSDVDNTLSKLIGVEIILSLLAMIGAAVVARTLVLRSLRPLNRVAATAQQVSQLELDRGEVALAVRVPPQDANPTNEVGRVGQAFNHMLTNVDGALAARQASEMKVRQFVADASHELRNPLAAIRGYAELTRRDRDTVPPEMGYALTRVEAETERMSGLVEDLLLLARLDAGPNIDFQPVDLTELVINATSDARAAGADHEWSLSLPDEPVIGSGDQHRLHQVVANLLANARTHTPAGTRVQVGLGVDGDQAVITVSDDGPGVPPEIRDRVFERFTRADASRVRNSGVEGGSTGLGLAIVAAVMEAHHGTVRVDSLPGRTDFTLRLPLS